ncbi:MAG: hypothetical protein SVU24_08285 [Pseudomonadota bacterium]|nr:hypothetical protein [Pseudomonadota bacterium]
MVSDGVVLAAALVSAGLLLRQSEDTPAAQSLLLKVSRLALLGVALAALSRLTLSDGGQDIATLRRMLDNLALYAALPLLASAMLGATLRWYWSKAGWGRWLLGLFALFELCRRMGLGEAYTLTLGGAIGLVLLGAALRLRGILPRLAAVGSGALFAVAICTPRLPLPPLPEDLLPLALAAALPLFAIALLNQLERAAPR